MRRSALIAAGWLPFMLGLVFHGVLQAKPPVLEPALEPGSSAESPLAGKAALDRPSIATGDTIWIADWSFDAPNGTCDDNGWTRYDNRILNDGSNYWSIKTNYAGIGGITDHAAALAKHDLGWVRDGYGNDWDYSIILNYQGPSTLTFNYLSYGEVDDDFLRVEADSAGASEARVDYSLRPGGTPATYRTVLFSVSGPQNAVAGPIALPDFGAPAMVHEVYIRYSSDANYSDADGLYAGVLTAATLALCFLLTKFVFFTADNGFRTEADGGPLTCETGALTSTSVCASATPSTSRLPARSTAYRWPSRQP